MDGIKSDLVPVGDLTSLSGLSSCGLVGLVIVDVGVLVTMDVGVLVTSLGIECGSGVLSGAGEGCDMP